MFSNKEITKPACIHSNTVAEFKNILNSIGSLLLDFNFKVKFISVIDNNSQETIGNDVRTTLICSKNRNNIEGMSIKFLRPTGNASLLQLSRSNNNDDTKMFNISTTKETRYNRTHNMLT